jgi:hypothetical protein
VQTGAVVRWWWWRWRWCSYTCRACDAAGDDEAVYLVIQRTDAGRVVAMRLASLESMLMSTETTGIGILTK